jgi:periplasmic divalent cation tolerance protein
MTVYMVYMTTGSKEEASEIGKVLITERLAACVNIYHPIESIYEWEGRIQMEAECACIAKTSEDRLPALIERVRGLHSYECPCIVAFPLAHGNPDFLKWIWSQTRHSPPIMMA